MKTRGNFFRNLERSVGLVSPGEATSQALQRTTEESLIKAQLPAIMSRKDKAKLDNWALRSRQVLRFRDYLEENEPDSAKLGLLTKDLLRKATKLASLTEAVDDEEDFCPGWATNNRDFASWFNRNFINWDVSDAARIKGATQRETQGDQAIAAGQSPEPAATTAPPECIVSTPPPLLVTADDVERLAPPAGVGTVGAGEREEQASSAAAQKPTGHPPQSSDEVYNDIMKVLDGCVVENDVAKALSAMQPFSTKFRKPALPAHCGAASAFRSERCNPPTRSEEYESARQTPTNVPATMAQRTAAAAASVTDEEQRLPCSPTVGAVSALGVPPEYYSFALARSRRGRAAREVEAAQRDLDRALGEVSHAASAGADSNLARLQKRLWIAEGAMNDAEVAVLKGHEAFAEHVDEARRRGK